MLDSESLLFVSILQKAYPLSPQPPAEIFLRHFASQIDQTCGVLKLLGLVEEASSNLGFKPTHRLIEIITDRMVQPTAVGDIDNNLVDSLWRLVAWADEEEEDERDEQEDEHEIEDCQGGGDGLAFCRQVFVVLGLLEEKADLGYLETSS
jgi:hypothetical protein